MLEARSAAVVDGDRDAFLETSNQDQIDVDANWFDDLAAHQPLTVTMTTASLNINGDSATADTSISATFADSDSNNLQEVRGQLQSQFQRSGDTWLWGGPRSLISWPA